jgi:hypothetical protein
VFRFLFCPKITFINTLSVNNTPLLKRIIFCVSIGVKRNASKEAKKQSRKIN